MLGPAQEAQILVPSPDLLNQNLPFNKMSGGSMPTKPENS